MLPYIDKKHVAVILGIVYITLLPLFAEAGHKNQSSNYYSYLPNYASSFYVQDYDSGGCCGHGSSYDLNSYYYTDLGRTQSAFGLYPYSSYSPFGIGSLSSFSGYPYSLGYTQPYSLGNLGLGYTTYPSFGNFGYTSSWGGLTQTISNEYTAEQSYTRYVPGGEITNSVSESTEITTFPGWGNYGISPYNVYSSFGVGGFGGTFGWPSTYGWY
jgi:hypothetical protein